jgi:hypothetical protein
VVEQLQSSVVCWGAAAHQFPESVTQIAAPIPCPMSLSSTLTSGTRASTTIIGWEEAAVDVISLEDEIPQVPLINDQFLFDDDEVVSPDIDEPENSELKTADSFFGSDCCAALSIERTPILL